VSRQLLLAVAASAGFGVAASTQQGDSSRLTPWGEPDISGVYAEFTTAPLERPAELGDREFLTDEEFEIVERIRLAGEEVVESVPTGEVHYDMSIYSLNANEGVSSPNRRTSIVVSPRNGRIPPLLPQAAARAQERENWRIAREFDGPEYRTLQERCIVWSTTLPPILPRGYNSNLQIFQSPGQVLIQGEMGDARIIPTDGRPLPENPPPQWNGTSVGRWEDGALVVETTGFVESAGYHPYTAWRNAATSSMRMTERFTRIDHDTIEYAFTVEDPETWAEPWSGVYPLTEMDEVLFEYACTEGNYGMANILSGARATENDAAAQ
jgi:hypothetical protein